MGRVLAVVADEPCGRVDDALEEVVDSAARSAPRKSGRESTP
jgi:hypothetical protein